MKRLVTDTAGFIDYHLAKKLLELGHEVVGYDNINDYCDINLKYTRLNKFGINRDNLKDNQPLDSITYPKYKFIKTNLEDTEVINKLFETKKFNAVCNLAIQIGIRCSIENPHTCINSNVVAL